MPLHSGIWENLNNFYFYFLPLLCDLCVNKINIIKSVAHCSGEYWPSDHNYQFTDIQRGGWMIDRWCLSVKFKRFCKIALTKRESTIMQVQLIGQIGKGGHLKYVIPPSLNFLLSRESHLKVYKVLPWAKFCRIWWLQAPQDQTVSSVQLNIMDIYVNVGRPLSNPSNRKREIQSSQNIYENILSHTLEPNGTGPALSGNKHMQTSLHVHNMFYTQGHTNRIDSFFQKQLVERNAKTKKTIMLRNTATRGQCSNVYKCNSYVILKKQRMKGLFCKGESSVHLLKFVHNS